MLTIVPWTIRNQVVMHRFIPVSDETGITLVDTYKPASAANFHNTLKLFELEGTDAWQATSLPASTARTGVRSFWILRLLALAGAFTRLVRGAPKWVWWVPLLLALSVALVNVETPRVRAPSDPFLILLASAGLATVVSGVKRRLGDRAPVGREGRDAVPARPAELVEMRQRLA